MAKITIGLGFVRTPEDEEELRRSAAALPDDWEITMVGSPTTGIFDVRVKGPVINGSMSFAPNGIDSAIRLLHSFRSLVK